MSKQTKSVALMAAITGLSASDKSVTIEDVLKVANAYNEWLNGRLKT